MKYVKMVLRVLLGIFMTYAGVSHLTIARQEFRDFRKDVRYGYSRRKIPVTQ